MGVLRMRIGDADRIRRYLCGRVEKVRLAAEGTKAIRAGDVHGVLGLVNAYPNVCQVLNGKKFHSLVNASIFNHRRLVD